MRSMTSAGADRAAQGQGDGPLFSADAIAPAGLSPAELASYREKGWVGIYPLFSPEGVQQTCRLRDQVWSAFTWPVHLAQSEDPQAFRRKPWFKSMHAYIPEYYDAACHPAVVRRVASILGPDVIAWGLTLIKVVPNEVHRWHVDVEHRHWDGVSVYIGLENISQRSSLKVVEGSQEIPEPPQAFGPIADDAAALKAARSRVPGAEVVTVGLQPGQFFLFAGRLWHASHNIGDQQRTAMIAHYSRPDANIRIPLSFDDPVRWHGWRPPCILVSGRDTAGVNRLVARPHREVQA